MWRLGSLGCETPKRRASQCGCEWHPPPVGRPRPGFWAELLRPAFSALTGEHHCHRDLIDLWRRLELRFPGFCASRGFLSNDGRLRNKRLLVSSLRGGAVFLMVAGRSHESVEMACCWIKKQCTDAANTATRATSRESQNSHDQHARFAEPS